MRIESVELDNFKSFGIRKTIGFSDGFTVISGPNGSGKSNIGDALLFVLGLRSTKLLRADRLPDFIHKAASHTRQKNYCRVTLSILDDSDPLQETRYVITRELAQEGADYKSNFYINGEKCRRSDVESLIERLQIYLDSYSFVLQGDINNIIKMTGTERRKLLESISGIESYDVKLEKAKSDIAGIESNLSVIKARIEEKSVQLERLRVEKESAEKYQQLSSTIADYRYTIMEREMQAESRQIEMYSSELQRTDLRIEEITSEISGLDATLEEIGKSVAEVESRMASVRNEKFSQLQERVNALKVKKGVSTNTIEDSTEEIERLRAEIKERGNVVEEIEAKISFLESEEVKFRKDLQETIRELSEVESQISKMNEGELGALSNISSMNEKIRQIDSDISGLNIKLSEITLKSEGLEAKRTELFAAGAALASQQSVIQVQIKDAKWRIGESGDAGNASHRKLSELQTKFENLRKKASELKGERSEIDLELKRLIREHEKLSASFVSRGGKAVKSIFDAVSRGEITGVYGTLRSLISIDEKYSKALDSAGGSRLNSIVVDSDETAEKCITVLKKEKTGRLTFLPLNKIMPSTPRGKSLLIRNSGDAISFMHEVVQCDQRYRNALLLVLGDTLLMKDTATARKNMGGVRMVTIDGDIFEANGAITGGFSEQKSSHEDDSMIPKLLAEISDRENRLKQIDQDIAAVDVELQTVTTELAEASGSSAAGRQEIATYQRIIDENEPKLKEITDKLNENSSAVNSIEEEIRACKKDISLFKEKIGSLEKERKALMEKMEKVSPELISRKRELEASNRKLISERDRIQAAISEITASIRERTAERSSELSLVSSMENKIKELEGRISESRKILEESVSELAKLEAVQKTVSTELSEMSAKLDALRAKEDETRKNRDSLVQNRGELRESRTSIQVKIDLMNSKIEEIRSQIAEINGKTISTDETNQEIKKRIQSISQEIEALGSINQRAIEEFQTESEELNSLHEKVEQLNAEKKSLEDLTVEINRQKKIVFLDLFDSINREINSIYYVLSDGGDAGLEITDRENPLEAEVYIKARPKGSNYSKLEALSGGEKSLTAMAFIMAVQRINPSPVYYLDEVDMFLDGANAERVGKMFKENSQKSQIIAVSLRQAMLKYADNIIGVTTFDDENSEVFFKSFDEKHDEKADEKKNSEGEDEK